MEVPPVRLYEFDANDPHNRKAAISLRHINTLKKVKQARREEFAKRKILMGLMYGDQDAALDARERELDDKIHRLEMLKGEIRLMIDRAEIDHESRQHIQKMAARFLDKK